MTVLVDQARWPWRGLRWAHLVSDCDVNELHRFAGRLGLRRLGFQGDHYDVTVAQRAVAVSLGARAVDSRVLVRRLREAGLRRPAGSPSPRWRAVADGTTPPRPGGPPDDWPAELLAPWVADPAVRADLVGVAGWFEAGGPRRIRVLTRAGEVAVALSGRPGSGEPPTGTGVARYGPHPEADGVLVECFIGAGVVPTTGER